ncbi:hypothetical protein [Bhargavaea cecembensis]|uniref:hypothetical protein n=1 Tax=Bhargavaea cecembensis TaxID=394098 RepID=UPI0011777B13|nr:hypothetical protein [Bhargavaea cecembensis]
MNGFSPEMEELGLEVEEFGCEVEELGFEVEEFALEVEEFRIRKRLTTFTRHSGHDCAKMPWIFQHRRGTQKAEIPARGSDQSLCFSISVMELNFRIVPFCPLSLLFIDRGEHLPLFLA